MERAFTLWEEGAITITAVAKDFSKGKNRMKGLASILNKKTGKKSTRGVAFSDTNWGEKTRKYMDSIKSIPDRAYQKIADAAQPFVTPRSASRHMASDDDEAENGNAGEVETDKRALLVYISDTSEDV